MRRVLLVMACVASLMTGCYQEFIEEPATTEELRLPSDKPKSEESERALRQCDSCDPEFECCYYDRCQRCTVKPTTGSCIIPTCV